METLDPEILFMDTCQVTYGCQNKTYNICSWSYAKKGQQGCGRFVCPDHILKQPEQVRYHYKKGQKNNSSVKSTICAKCEPKLLKLIEESKAAQMERGEHKHGC